MVPYLHRILRGKEKPDGRHMCLVAVAYQYGFGCRKNPDLAWHWYVQAVCAGDAEAMYRLGRIFCSGDQPRWRMAAICFLRSAAKGYVPAMKELGILYHRGYGVQKDDEKSFAWFLEGARNGNRDCMEALAAYCRTDREDKVI